MALDLPIESEISALAEQLTILASHTRLRILGILVKQGMTTPGDLMGLLNLVESTLHNHLAMLMRGELVTKLKRGRITYYIVQPDKLQRVLDSTLKLLTPEPGLTPEGDRA